MVGIAGTRTKSKSLDGPKTFLEKVLDDLSGPMYRYLFEEELARKEKKTSARKTKR